MEFDSAAANYGWMSRGNNFRSFTKANADTLLEEISKKWAAAGYVMPKLVFWNVDARQNNIPLLGNNRISYVSGFSPSIFQTIMSGATGYELMMKTLNNSRYDAIHQALDEIN